MTDYSHQYRSTRDLTNEEKKRLLEASKMQFPLITEELNLKKESAVSFRHYWTNKQKKKAIKKGRPSTKTAAPASLRSFTTTVGNVVITVVSESKAQVSGLKVDDEKITLNIR